MRWRTKRKLIYTSFALLPLVVIAAVVYITTFFPDPTCSDGILNQNEAGIDCGGVCDRICQDQTPDPTVRWDRAFQVSGDIYNLAAYIENPNTDLMAQDVPYSFRMYDQDNILITERRGEITLLPQPYTLAFVGGIDTNGREPYRVVFSLTEPPFWEEVDITDVRFSTSDRRLETTDRPTLSANITNSNQRDYEDIYLAALILGPDGEVLQVSRTFIDYLAVAEEESIVFTWREAFPPASSYRSEILPISYQLVE